MEFIVTITMLCISLSVLLTPCASLHSDQLQSYHELAHDHQQFTLPTLPRKLKLNELVATVKENGDKGLNKQKEVSSGKSHQKEAQVMHEARIGTRQEWIQGSDTDTTQFFTMDYSHVRRRRPIHNKSLPVAP